MGSLICFSESVVVCVFSAETVRDPTPAPPLQGRGAATAGEDVLGQCYIVAPKKSQGLGRKNGVSIFPNSVRVFPNGVRFFPKRRSYLKK